MHGARRTGSSATEALPVRVPDGTWLSDEVFLMRWYGEVDGMLANRGLQVIKAAIRERPPKYVIIDATAMTGFKRDVRDAAVACLKEFKESGMERMFAVMPGSAIRMFLSAMTIVVSAKVEFCADMNTAFQGLAKLGVSVSR